MEATLKAGQRLRSVADDTEVVVILAPDGPIEISCGGHPMAAIDQDLLAADLDPGWAEGTLVGKRYADAELGLEVLCIRPGAGTLAIGSVALENAQTKPLPASD
jgi:hypothetical protein